MIAESLYLLLKAGSDWPAAIAIVAVAEAHAFSLRRAFESGTISTMLLILPYTILALSLMP